MIRQSALLKGSWQTLIVLDACRYDIFSDAIVDYDLPGKLTEVDSEASRTSIWYRHHWREKHDDIVLVSAHPMIWSERKDANFHQAIIVPGRMPDCWNPNCTLGRAISLRKSYPDKKFLLHIIAPHLPYQGKEGKSFIDILMGGDYYDNQKQVNGTGLYKNVFTYGNKYGWEKLRYYYRENLNFALSIVLEYIKLLKPPIVITSDHGEHIGEGGKYGHKGNSPKLPIVPWFEVAA